jgi:hypothetical protein
MSTRPDRPTDESTGRPGAGRRARRDDEPVLPGRSDAEREEAWGDQPRSRERDAQWYREQRPPHHE